MPVAKLLPPHRGPKEGERQCIDFSKMGGRGREAWKRQQSTGFDLINPPAEVMRGEEKIQVTGVLRCSPSIRVTEKEPDYFEPKMCFRKYHRGRNCELLDPWSLSMDKNGARRGIHIIDGPGSFFYPGPCTIEELTAVHMTHR